MDASDIEEAREALRSREGIPPNNKDKRIGHWSSGDPSPSEILDLPEWANARGVQHVIWTALPPKFDGTEQTPTKEQIVQYLGGLTGTKRADAEHYIRFTPRQIDTTYRRYIEEQLQWTANNAS
jgi:hypothetical protein